MDLRRKLARLGDAGPGSAPRSAGEGGGTVQPPSSLLPPDDAADARRARIERLRSMIRSMGTAAEDRRRREPTEPTEPTGAAARRMFAELPGDLRETEWGAVHVVERWLEPSHCHGRVAVRGALSVRAEMVATLALDPALQAFDPRRMLLLDTETTGLAGGAGTIPFLVGLAWFEDESLCVRQLFLRRPGEEAPMLRMLAERLAQASCIVTYNGKSFDWPLLRTRFVLNRVPVPDTPPHLDLLTCARRVLKPRLEALRLVNLEAKVLGLYREGDVDGSEIPALYLGWLRSLDPSPLLPVIEHNANDLVALAAVLARLCAHFEDVRPEDDPRDHLAYARLAVRAGDAGRAVAFAQAAADGGEPEVALDAFLLLAHLSRRRGDVEGEGEALLRALDAAEGSSAGRAPEAHLRLAKHFEHRRKDAARALMHARHTAGAEEPEAQLRRLARLERRLARAAEATSGPA